MMFWGGGANCQRWATGCQDVVGTRPRCDGEQLRNESLVRTMHNPVPKCRDVEKGEEHQVQLP